MTHPGDIGIVLFRVDEEWLGAGRGDQPEHGAHRLFRRGDRWRDAPGRPGKEIGIGALDALRLAGHGVSANEMHLPRQNLGGPAQDLRFGRAGIGDDRAWLEVRSKILHHVPHCVDGGRKHDHVGIASRLGQIPSAFVDGPEFFRGALVVEIGIEADDFERLAPVDFPLLGPPAQGEADRTADQSQPDDQHTLHRR